MNETEQNNDTTENNETKKKDSKFFLYGNDGLYMKIGDLKEFIPRFKDYYYDKKQENPNASVIGIITSFNEMIAPDKFYPYPTQYRIWRKKWDREILEKAMGAVLAVESPVSKAIKTRDEQNNLMIPTDEDMEDGAKTLGAELVNDAMMMLKKDQAMGEDMFTDEMLVKRRRYVLTVYNHVISAANRKEALKIKKQQEKRETAGFLMDLIRSSTAGHMSQDDIDILKGSVINNSNNNE